MFLVLRHLHWHALAPDGRCLDLADWWTASRKSLAKEDRKCFDSLVILTSWMIWNERNRRTFDSRAKTVGELVSCLEDEATSWVLARFRHISAFAAACGRVTGRLVLQCNKSFRTREFKTPVLKLEMYWLHFLLPLNEIRAQARSRKKDIFCSLCA